MSQIPKKDVKILSTILYAVSEASLQDEVEAEMSIPDSDNLERLVDEYGEPADFRKRVVDSDRKSS